MELFKKLASELPGVDISITLKEKNGKYTVSVLPCIGNKAGIQPIIVTGTPDELDEQFIELIKLPMIETSAAIINLEEHKESTKVSEKVKEEKPKTEKTKAQLPAQPKKEAPKKEAAAEADLFATISTPDAKQEEEPSNEGGTDDDDDNDDENNQD